MKRLSLLLLLSLLSVLMTASRSDSANTPNFSFEVVRPRTGGQLYAQRIVTLQAGQMYSRIMPSKFVEQWQTASQQPTHEQWQSLLAHEAAIMTSQQGQSPLSILVGDSLCLWIPQEDLPNNQLWLNQSISGETTAHLLRRLTYFANTQPNAIYVMAGVNDLKTNVDPEVTVSNMELVVQRLRAQHPHAQIVVLSILPTRLPSIPSSLVGQVNQHLAIAVERRQAKFVDLQPAFMDSDGLLQADLTTDGLHLNAAGYRLFAAYLTNPQE